MRQYLDLLDHVLKHGNHKMDRTGTGTRSIFGYQMRYPLAKGFPLLTTRALHFRSIAHELLWFLQGSTDVRVLQKAGVSIWDEWADEQGQLGPIYGAQWRRWRTADGNRIDQLSRVVEQIRTDPDSRRLVVSAWNAGELHNMALPPCHVLFQFYVADGQLSCQLYQRSADVFLGLPFNIASYSLLTRMVAQVVGLKAGQFIHSLGDVHLYNNHIEQAETQLARTPFPAPALQINPEVRDLFAFRYQDFTLVDYQYHPAIKAPVAV